MGCWQLGVRSPRAGETGGRGGWVRGRGGLQRKREGGRRWPQGSARRQGPCSQAGGLGAGVDSAAGELEGVCYYPWLHFPQVPLSCA